MSATRWQQVVVMEFGKRHDTADTTEFCLRQLVTDDVLQRSYGETGVMDFGKVCYEEVADLLWTCYAEVANLFVTDLLCYGLLVIHGVDLLRTCE